MGNRHRLSNEGILLFDRWPYAWLRSRMPKRLQDDNAGGFFVVNKTILGNHKRCLYQILTTSLASNKRGTAICSDFAP